MLFHLTCLRFRQKAFTAANLSSWELVAPAPEVQHCSTDAGTRETIAVCSSSTQELTIDCVALHIVVVTCRLRKVRVCTATAGGSSASSSLPNECPGTKRRPDVCRSCGQHAEQHVVCAPEGAVAQGIVLFCCPTDCSGSSAACASHSSSVLSTCHSIVWSHSSAQQCSAIAICMQVRTSAGQCT